MTQVKNTWSGLKLHSEANWPPVQGVAKNRTKPCSSDHVISVPKLELNVPSKEKLPKGPDEMTFMLPLMTLFVAAFQSKEILKVSHGAEAHAPVKVTLERSIEALFACAGIAVMKKKPAKANDKRRQKR